MEFDTPKGKMIFRKEDHQALQSMYHFKVKVDPNVAWAVLEPVRELKIEDMNIPIQQQAVSFFFVSPRRSRGERDCWSRRVTTSCLMTHTLETRDLTIRFGGHVAVNRVSCTFRPGELTAIVGPNGAGKTTYFNLISGQLRPTDGSILFDGKDITQLSAPLRTRAGLGRAFQLTNLFPNLSVEENVRLAVQSESGVHYDMLRPWMTRKDLIARADAILDKVALGSRRTVAATALSHGDQRKLEVALMMALEPRSSCSTSQPPA